MFKRYAAIILLIACAAGLAFGIYRLFTLRFEGGDVYPQYSTLRADPLGTMAFYDSLDRLPGMAVRRDLSSTNLLPNEASTTYFHLAASMASIEAFPDSLLREIERFASSGGRLVITLSPVGAKGFQPPPPPADPASKPKPVETPTHLARWGVHVEIVDLEPLDNLYLPEFVDLDAEFPIPAELEWHSGAVFKNLHPDWKPIYVRDMDPVMIQRAYGRGTVVIATDSYFLSNEAMLLDRHADLLSFLVGPNRNVVFDETHLGTIETPGIATLLRRYRLHWVGASVLLLALLFIWKMSMPLVPRPAHDRTHGYVIGKDAGAAIINLLRRSIRERDVLKVCFNEWKKSAPQAGTFSAARIRQAEAAFAAETASGTAQGTPVAAYQSISKILQRRIQ